MLTFKVWEPNLFRRISDGKSIENETELAASIPPMADPVLAAVAKSVGGSIKSTGQSFCFIAFLFALCMRYGANYILGQVRSLSLITHLMMMQLNIDPVALIFFAQILEYVTFDLVPTEDIYAALFGWTNEPYSEAADNIGYGSRVFIENTGSLLVYFAIIVF